MNSSQVLLGHLPEETLYNYVALNWQLVLLEMACHSLSQGQSTEPNFDQLLRIKRSVQVGSCGDWSWNDYSCCENGLPYVLQVHSAGDLLDKHWCKTLFPQLRCDTEIVDLSHLYLFVLYLSFDGSARDKSKKLLSL